MNNLIFTKISIFRNLKDYKFVSKLTDAKKEEIKEKIVKLYPNYKQIQELNKDKQANLTKFIQANSNCLVNEKLALAINLLNGEHVEICTISQEDLKKSFKKVKEEADFLAQNLSLAYSDEYGYLMSDITKIGNGIMLEAEISLPCIEELNKIEQIKQNLKKLGYVLSPTKFKSIYKLSTTCSLGLTETEIVEEYEKTLLKLQEIEIESAKYLDVENHDRIKDSAMRAYAILNGAYLLTEDEINTLLIKIITGYNLKMLDVNLLKLQEIQNLSYGQNKEFISQSEMKQLAEKVKNILKGE